MDNMTATTEAYKLIREQWKIESSGGTPEGASILFDAMSAIFRYHHHIKDLEIERMADMLEEKQSTCSHHGYEVLLDNMWMCRDCCQLTVVKCEE